MGKQGACMEKGVELLSCIPPTHPPHATDHYRIIRDKKGEEQSVAALSKHFQRDARPFQK